VVFQNNLCDAGWGFIQKYSGGASVVKRDGDYKEVVVHSVMGQDSQGGPKIQIRPIAGQVYIQELNVECSKKLSEKYPIGTRFKIKVQLTDMQGAPFLYSYFGWSFVVLQK
jgi:hypothetical protein